MGRDHHRQFSRLGGHPALDLANTVAGRLSAEPEERLSTPGDLLAWCRQTEVLTRDRLAAIRRQLVASPELGERTRNRTIAGRELLYRLFAARIDSDSPADADIAAVNRILAADRVRFVWRDRAYRWHRSGDPDPADEILLPIVRGAAELLTSSRAARISRCADDRGCGWLFLDLSRTRVRRWCSMQDCGNRAKARRHYRRTAHGG